MVARILSQVSEYDEIILYTCPRTGPSEAVPPPGPPGIRTTRYHGWLYAKRALPAQPADLESLQPGIPPPREIGGLPLAGHEELTIHWRSYAEYLSAFYAGDEGYRRLQTFLGDSLSPGLFRLIQSPPAASRLRAWWLNESPELEDVPWESIGLGSSRPAPLSIVRGRPPASVPPLPLDPDRPLTVAVIDPGGLAPDPVKKALADLGPAMAVVWIDEKDPHEALCEAARAGFEAVHLIADGSVPLGVEGLLHFPGGATLTPTEASRLLRGSRVALLSLSAEDAQSTDRAGLPTVFHAFARFGRALAEGPTIAAPLGPIAPPDLEAFWRGFYRRFAEVLDVEDALVAANPCPLRVPVVLFLRQRFGRQFTRSAADWDIVFDPSGHVGPAQASTDLAISGDVLEAAVELQKHYAALGLSFPCKGLLDEERDRQRALAAYLDHALARSKER